MLIEERRYGETARDYALRMLRRNIVAMTLKPGAMLSENELAARLGVSRTPVREALVELEKVHMIEVLPQRGSRVALIDYALVEEARYARQALEVAILPLTCERMTPEGLALLRQNLRLQLLAREPEMRDTLDLMQLDDAFHRLLFQIARRENTYAMLSGLMIHFDRVRALALHVVRETRIIEDHHAICEALAARQAQRAQELMELHLSRVHVDEETIRKAYPEFIKGMGEEQGRADTAE